MIQKLNSNDFLAIKDYLSSELEQNLFFLADVENYGVDGDKIEVFAHVVNDDCGCTKWDFLLLYYFTIAILYSCNANYDINVAVETLKTFTPLDSIGGKNELILPLKDFFPSYTFRPCSLLSCTPDTFNNNSDNSSHQKDGTTRILPNNFTLHTLSADEADELFDFYLTIDEFSHTYKGQEERFRERVGENLKKDSTAYVLRDANLKGKADNQNADIVYTKGKLISSVQAGAQCSTGSMLLGVATNPAYRSQGLATILVRHACSDQFKKGRKFIALFFDNPDAGRLYEKAGFKEVGTYTVLQNRV